MELVLVEGYPSVDGDMGQRNQWTRDWKFSIVEGSMSSFHRENLLLHLIDLPKREHTLTPRRDGEKWGNGL